VSSVYMYMTNQSVESPWQKTEKRNLNIANQSAAVLWRGLSLMDDLRYYSLIQCRLIDEDEHKNTQLTQMQLGITQEEK